MNSFLKKILWFALAFFLFDKIFYLAMVTAPDMEIDKRLEQIITGNMNHEIIVLGSSRGARNIIASQIEDSLGVSTYNLSYPGSNIEFHDFLLEAIIKHNKVPKKVLLAIDEPDELLYNEMIQFRYDRLYPLVGYSYINNKMIERGEKNQFSKVFILNRINVKEIRFSPKKFTPLDTIAPCGSMYVSYQKANQHFHFPEGKPSYDISLEEEKYLKAFRVFQKRCLKNNIELHLVFSPNFRPHNFAFEQRITTISDKETNQILYNQNQPAYKDSNYFFDVNHLQYKGAKIFTDEIIRQIR